MTVSNKYVDVHTKKFGMSDWTPWSWEDFEESIQDTLRWKDSIVTNNQDDFPNREYGFSDWTQWSGDEEP